MATNTLVTNSIILKEGMMHLENNLVVSKLCNRDFESEFGGPVKNGQSIKIARPIRGQVRTGATMQAQDITEGSATFTVATQIGADLEFTSQDLTLSVDKFSERILRPQMIKLANQLDQAVMTELVNNTYNWVGTPGTQLTSFAGFAKAPQRLDQLAVPTDRRVCILGPTDYWGMLNNITGLYIADTAKSALERAKMPMLGGVDMYMSQNIIQHTNGTWSAGTAYTITGTGLSASYSNVKDSWTFSTQINNLTATVGTVALGDVFTVSTVFAVNPITGTATPFLQQFTVVAAVTADSNGIASVTISPPPIVGGPYATVNTALAAGLNVTRAGSANTAYDQSVVFHPDAVTLAVPPLIKPQGAAWCDAASYEGFNLRLVQGYDITNDLPQWRFDLIYGVKCHQPWLSTRLSGT
ncbi:MAG: P22 phage major capsid protein family protein [Isosphaeraceae bacterium]